MPKLENWSVSGTSYGFLVPEAGTKLVGEVYGHKMYGNGAKIKTSVVIVFDLTNKVVETQNTIYTLGEVDREYKKWCEERGIEL